MVVIALTNLYLFDGMGKSCRKTPLSMANYNFWLKNTILIE